MAITLHSLSQAATFGRGRDFSSTAVSDPVADAFKAAGARIAQQREAAEVRLSASGRIKSAFGELQAAGKALAKLGDTASADEVGKAVQSFANAFNNAVRTGAAPTRADDDRRTAPLAGDDSVRRAGRAVNRAVTEGDTTAELRKIGIGVNKDGTLAVDAKALANAIQSNPSKVQEVLVKVGGRSEQVATKELAATGDIGRLDKTLEIRARNLAVQENQQKEIAAAAQSALQRQNESTNLTTARGIAAYRKVFAI